MMTPLDYSKIITPEFCRKIGLEKPYPYRAMDDIPVTSEGLVHFGWFTHPSYEGVPGELVIWSKLPSAKNVLRVYVHEVAHQIAYEAGLDDALHGTSHNCYFAILNMVMLRRSDNVNSLKMYDFNEGVRVHEKTVITDDDELIDRFAFILKTSASYAASDLTIETIAKKLYQNYAKPEWQTGKKVMQGCANPNTYPMQKFFVGLFTGLMSAASIASFAMLLKH